MNILVLAKRTVGDDMGASKISGGDGLYSLCKFTLIMPLIFFFNQLMFAYYIFNDSTLNYLFSGVCQTNDVHVPFNDNLEKCINTPVKLELSCVECGFLLKTHQFQNCCSH